MFTMTASMHKEDTGRLGVRRLPIPSWETITRLADRQPARLFSWAIVGVPLAVLLVRSLASVENSPFAGWLAGIRLPFRLALLFFGGVMYLVGTYVLSLRPKIVSWYLNNPPTPAGLQIPGWFEAARHVAAQFRSERTWIGNTRYMPTKEVAHDLWERCSGPERIWDLGATGWQTEAAALERLEAILKNDQNRQSVFEAVLLAATWNNFGLRLLATLCFFVAATTILIGFIQNIVIVIAAL